MCQSEVYPQVKGILTSMQTQPYLIDSYVRHKLNLGLRIYGQRAAYRKLFSPNSTSLFHNSPHFVKTCNILPSMLACIQILHFGAGFDEKVDVME